MRTHRSHSAPRPDTPNGTAIGVAPVIGVSIMSERGERYRYRARAVSLRMKHGVVQIIERERGCFVWFERCNIEVRDGRRRARFRLLSGSAWSNGVDLAIVAEIARKPGRPAVNGRSPRTSGSECRAAIGPPPHALPAKTAA